MVTATVWNSFGLPRQHRNSVLLSTPGARLGATARQSAIDHCPGCSTFYTLWLVKSMQPRELAKGRLMLKYRMRSPDALAAAYATVAARSLIRSEHARESGLKPRAKEWRTLAEYCADMARSRAFDDDQYRFQRDKIRWRRLLFAAPDALQALAPSVPGPEQPQQVVEPWEEALIDLALGYLPEQQRACYEMAIGGGMAPDHIAKALGLSGGQVRQQLARARQRIRDEVTARLTVPPIYTGPDGARSLERLLDAVMGFCD